MGRKHKIGKAHILAAMANDNDPLAIGDGWFYVGVDDRGVELEIILLPDDRAGGDWGDCPRHAHRVPGVTMSERKPPKIGPDTSIEDIDLDEEEFYYHGERLTEERAEQIADETLAQVRRRNLISGRKSLTGGSVHSPRVQFRVPERIRGEAEYRAQVEGKSVSVLAREALEHYLTEHRKAS